MPEEPDVVLPHFSSWEEAGTWAEHYLPYRDESVDSYRVHLQARKLLQAVAWHCRNHSVGPATVADVRRILIEEIPIRESYAGELDNGSDDRVRTAVHEVRASGRPWVSIENGRNTAAAAALRAVGGRLPAG